MTLICPTSIEDETNAPILFLDEKAAHRGPDSTAIRDKASMRQCLDELNAEVSVVLKDRIPVRSDEFEFTVNCAELLLAEPKAMSGLEDIPDFRRRNIDQFLRPDWPIVPEQLELFPGERSRR